MFECLLVWKSTVATHCDRYYANNTSDQQASLPPNLAADIRQLEPGQACATTFAAGEWIPPHAPAQIITFAANRFASPQRHMPITPRLGRFYPRSFAWEALDCSRSDFRPFRVIGKANDQLVADLNHPLARYPLALEICFLDKPANPSPVTNDIAERLIQTDSGLQAPYPGITSDFYSVYPFTRPDEREDAMFYTNPRMVNHLDSTALAQVKAIYARLLQPEMRVLDLMSSWVSHLPESLMDLHVTGLGMNQAELNANPRLAKHIVQDLNQNPLLPFADNHFDAIICTVSIEYLTQPLQVMRELARVTRAGGLVIMTFSDRWFPPKVITVWPEMHPFERQGLVLDYFLQTATFTDLHTESIRGLPRPPNDPHIRQTKLSDPVFAVWGTVAS